MIAFTQSQGSTFGKARFPQYDLERQYLLKINCRQWSKAECMEGLEYENHRYASVHPRTIWAWAKCWSGKVLAGTIHAYRPSAGRCRFLQKVWKSRKSRKSRLWNTRILVLPVTRTWRPKACSNYPSSTFEIGQQLITTATWTWTFSWLP